MIITVKMMTMAKIDNNDDTDNYDDEGDDKRIVLMTFSYIWFLKGNNIMTNGFGDGNSVHDFGSVLLWK